MRIPLTGPERGAMLLMYGYPDMGRTVYGLAVLDEDGRVVLDSPGARSHQRAGMFAAEIGLAYEFRHYGTEWEARAVLARRAARWHETGNDGLPVHDGPDPLAVPGELRPRAGTVEGAPRPVTVLSWDGDALVAADPASGSSARITPTAFYHYRYGQTLLGSCKKEKPKIVSGLAVLDGDGLVLLDLPGEWSVRDVAGFAAERGVPVRDALAGRAERTCAVLAGRAPGWRRLIGLPLPAVTPRWKRFAMFGLGVSGLLVMAYLGATFGWVAWRGLSGLGRLLLDIVDVKWLLAFFSPLAVLLAPVRRALHMTRQALHMRRGRRGAVLGPPGGPHLSVRNGVLRIRPALRANVTETSVGWEPHEAAGLLVYRHESSYGLFVVSRGGLPLCHLPGPWQPEDAHRFAVRHDLGCEVRTLSREEYLDLAGRTRDALP
ncbi:hypothetical protein [Streptosporangium sp. NBC_01756]|uniref:hypothetical protein n=1 Tax=Streptosporangium sp. NBC_01756 TaxID=2975950 RepID=UPI002DDA1809|nr:hypothetical protein [Streptosporangium sp. NBC_01756]WSC87983.1 hypothetical protein OIE48_07160 [Streptosporangium sp. NBC_01756]